jgi:signal transduction histidine kinase/ligand-binding sensor domain-containing protein
MLKNNLILFLIFLSQSVFSQNECVKFDRLKSEDGLINEYILSIYKDSKGFMWFGTYGGLDRFDSYTHKKYALETDTNYGIKNDAFFCIYEDTQGNMWFGTAIGLCRYVAEKDTFIFFSHISNDPNSISNDKVRQILQDESGTFWIATYGGGLNKFIPDSNKFYNYKNDKNNPNSLPNDQVNTIYVDSKKNFWVGTEGGLVCFDKKHGIFHSFKETTGISDELRGKIISSIYDDRKGNLWIGTWNDGIFIYNFDSKTLKNINPIPDCKSSKKGFNVRAISGDNQGNVWFASMGSGLISYNLVTGKFRVFTNDPFDKTSLSYDLLWSVYVDNMGVVWAGTAGSGLCTLDPNNHKFKCFRQERDDPNTISSNYVTSLFVDHANELWIGTELKGLNRLDRKTGRYSYFLREPNLNIGAVRSFYEDENHFLWVGTDGGVFVFNEKREQIRHYKNIPTNLYSISSHPIEKICEDKLGNIWFATWNNGVYILTKDELLINNADEARFINYRHNALDTNSLTSNIVWEVHSDRFNNLWIADEGALDKFDFKSKTFVHYKIKTVNALFEDNDGLWISTFGNGIYHLDLVTDKLTYLGYYFLANTGIIRDLKHNIWIPSEKGLYLLNLEGENSFLFTEKDGLQSNRFNQNANVLAPDGTIFIGGFNGYNSFLPDEIHTDTTQPNVIFTDLYINGKLVSQGQEGPNSQVLLKPLLYTDTIKIKHNQNNFSFEYAALQYSGAHDLKYRYKLLPYDTSWYYTSATQRKAIYTNLNPGSYQLIVGSTNRDGLWSSHTAQMSIIIEPAWYQTLWFKILVLLIIILLLFLLFSYRLRQIKLKNVELERLVEVRTKELSVKNTLLSKQTNELSEINTILEEKQQQIEQQSEELLAINNQLNEKNTLLIDQAEYLRESNALLEESRQHSQDQAEELMVQKEELERVNLELNELNATKDKFFSIIAHDIKNPFNSILGFTELLQINFKIWTEEKKLQIVNILHNSSQNVYDLLENLLQWSRSQRGVIEFSPEKIKLVDQINFVFKLLENSADEKQITLTSAVEDENAIIYADVRMFHAILRNLVGNAIKFTHIGGNVQVLVENQDKNALIKVIDTGVGIPAEMIEKLFRIDSHLTTEGTNNEKGTGLGLILTKEFVLKNNGQIWVESEVAKGSIFNFTLPLYVSA